MRKFTPEQTIADGQRKVYKVVDWQGFSCVAVGSYRVRFPVGEFMAAPAPWNRERR